MRKLTPAQTAARDARRAKFRALVSDVAAMTDAQRAAIVDKLGAVPTCAGSALSFFNSCLVLSQNPAASLVGGFQQWRKLGRIVRKGEHGAMIWIPTGQAKGATDDTGEATDNDADGTRNACSMLYAACRKAGRALGHDPILTYTLPEEGGASLKAAGFILDKADAGNASRAWHNRPGRKALPVGNDLVGGKWRWVA